MNRFINLDLGEVSTSIIAEELSIAGIEFILDTSIGKFGRWSFKREHDYYVASVEKLSEGIPENLAMRLHYKERPSDYHYILGSVIRSGGHAGALDPISFGSSVDFDDPGTVEAYKKFPKDGCIICEIRESRELKCYVETYHIDTQEGLNEFVKFIKIHNLF